MALQLMLRNLFANAYSFFAPFLINDTDKFLVCVNYHYFFKGNVDDEMLEVSLKTFKDQAKFFSNNCDVYDINRAFEALDKNKTSSKRHSIILSIDDGHAGVLDILGIIEQFKIPIVMFICPGLSLGENKLDGLRSICLRTYFESYADKKWSPSDFFNKVQSLSYNELSNFYEKVKKQISGRDPIMINQLLTREQIMNLSQHPLVTIAAHTMSHVKLSDVSNEWIDWEIERSVEYVREWGGSSKFFAYPYGNKGSYNQHSIKALSGSGIKYAFTTKAHHIDEFKNDFELGRISVFNVSNYGYLTGTVRGAFKYYDMILRKF